MTAVTISSLLRAKRGAVAFTYTLTLLENVCTLAYPALTGLAVDGLLRREFSGLAALVGVWLVHLALSFARQRLDTRVFKGLCTRRLPRTSSACSQSQGHTTSTVSARVEMVRDIVGFFEKEVPAIFQNILMIVGSAAMLFVYDVDAGWIAMAVLLPMGLVNGWYWRKALRLNQGISSEIERWTPSSLADAFASHATSACCGTGA